MVWTFSFLFPLLGWMVALFLFFLPNIGFLVVNFSLFSWTVQLNSVFLIDSLSVSFLLVVLLVSAGVLVYSNEYMVEDIFKKKFMITMFVFIVSMVVLSFSADLFWLMIGWDGLGLSSFYLISFFQNWKSFNGAMVTFISNRMGDCFILLSFSWLFGFSSLSWEVDVMGSLLLMLGAFSKSAQFPFSAWLPLAMAAPTPVSSLVHSSTLVTAGVYLLIRFNKYVEELSGAIFLMSFLTVVLAGSSSLMEMDIKKVIALSTLSHIGLMIMSVSMGMIAGAMIHLMVHAMFKSLLFMVSGALIHFSANFQDIRLVSLSSSFPNSVAMVVSLLSMIGAPFLSGFVSKEMMFVAVQSKSLINLVAFFVAVVFTGSYSFRMLIYLFKNEWSASKEQKFSSTVFVMMGIFSVVGGSILKNSPVFQMEIEPFFFCDSSTILMLVLAAGCGSSFLVFNCYTVKTFLHEMWYVTSFSTFFQKKLFLYSWLSLFKSDSKGMLDTFLLSESKKMSTLSKDSVSVLMNPYLVLEVVCVIFMITLFLEFF